jgi:hypothetical protein
VLSGALIACLHIGIIEKLSAGAIDLLNVDRRSYRLGILTAPSL